MVTLLSNKELENLSSKEKIDYFSKIKEELTTDSKKGYNIGQKLISLIYPSLRNYDIEIRGEENLPKDDSVIFMCNHSNSHDIFNAYEVLSMINRTGSVMVATDCLNPLTQAVFGISDATLIDRRDKVSSQRGVTELAKKVIEGRCGVIFGEATWNLHPYLPMQPIKLGGTHLGAITEKIIIPTLFEYIEVPDILSKESDLYTKCIVTFCRPFIVDRERSLISQTQEIQQIMEENRRRVWEEYKLVRTKLEDINQEIYLNHTYLKKFKALGFTYDSERESEFLLKRNGKKSENEYTLDEQGNFVPGVTVKTRKR